MNKAAKIIAIISVILLFSACVQKSSVTAENCNLNKFTNERNGLKTNLLIKAEAPQEYTEDPIPENAICVPKTNAAITNNNTRTQE